MKDRWLDDIHDKMTGLEANEPAGLWQRIESGHQVVVPRRGARLLNWRRWWSAAAMLALTAGLIGMLVNLSHDKTLGVPDADGIALIENGMNADEVAELTPAGDNMKFRAADKTGKSNKAGTDKGGVPTASSNLYQQSNVDRASSLEVSDSVVMTSADETGDGSVENTTNRPVASDDSASAPSEVVSTDEVYELVPAMGDEPVYVKPRRAPLSIGVYTSGSSGVAVGHNNMDMNYAVSFPPSYEDNYIPVENVSPQIMSRRTGGSRSTIKHNISLKLGLSLAYNVTPVLSVETGLNYSRLSSDLEYYYYGGYIYNTGEQLLHYVGIPLNAKYTFFSWRSLSFYGTAGVLTEKLVSGSISGYAGNSPDRRKTDVEEKRWQWSVNAGVGARFNFTRNIGIYVEPGVGYYFDNGSAVENTYKDRALNFNLNVGFRFNIGR